MGLLLTFEHRLVRTPDGAVWSPDDLRNSTFASCLEVFDEVVVAARVREASEAPRGRIRIDLPHVRFHPLPWYVGPLEYVRQLPTLRRSIDEAVRGADAFVFRVPSPIAGIAVPRARSLGRRYAVQVVGDPWDVFASGANRHLGRHFFRWFFARALRSQVAGAAAVAYVTERTLQQRYPAAPGVPAVSFSDVVLPEAAFSQGPHRPRATPLEPLKLVTVGSLEQPYKGVDVLVRAIADARRRGAAVLLTVVGDGRERPRLESMVEAHDLRAHVRFTGYVAAGDELRACLDAADVFVLASRTEGLPRALIEAMARGLPCLATRVGGVPELLSPEDLCAPGDHEALSALLRALVIEPERLIRMAVRNMARARDFAAARVGTRRRQFLRAVVAASAGRAGGP